MFVDMLAYQIHSSTSSLLRNSPKRTYAIAWTIARWTYSRQLHPFFRRYLFSSSVGAISPPPLPQYIDPIAIATRSVSTNTHSRESPARLHVLVFRFNFSGESRLKAACQLPPERHVTDSFVPFLVYSVETCFSLFSFPSSSLKYTLVHARENIYLRASKAIQAELKTIHFTADRGRYAGSIDVTRNCASNEKVPGFWRSFAIETSVSGWPGVSLLVSVNGRIARRLATGHAYFYTPV